MTNPIKSPCPGCSDPALRASLGMEGICTPCRKKERNRLWREANPGVLAANAKRWREAGNKSVRPPDYNEKRAATSRDRYATDEEYRARALAYAKKRRLEQPEKVKAENEAWQKANYHAVRKYQREYTQQRRASDPEYRQRLLNAQTLWRTRSWRPATGASGWVRDVASAAEIDNRYLARLHAWQEDHCYICNRKITAESPWVEHLIPRSRGGPNVQQNIVFACPSCQQSRQGRYWFNEWTPPKIFEGPSKLVKFRSILAGLTVAELNPELSSRGFFEISGPLATKHLYIISTFQCSERNPYAGKFLREIQQTDPDAVLILDWEWYQRQEAVLNMLRAKVGLSERGPGARELEIAEIPQSQANAFLESHHVMGSINEPIRVGLLDEGQILGLGVFSDRNQGQSLECVRLAFHGHIPGGMSKIFEATRRLYGRKPIVTFVDSRYADGGGHETIGFKHLGWSPETYCWVLPDRVQHQRYLSNDNKCSQNLLFFNPELPITENIKINGIFRLWLPKKRRMILGV